MQARRADRGERTDGHSGAGDYQRVGPWRACEQLLRCFETGALGKASDHDLVVAQLLVERQHCRAYALHALARGRDVERHTQNGQSAAAQAQQVRCRGLAAGLPVHADVVRFDP